MPRLNFFSLLKANNGRIERQGQNETVFIEVPIGNTRKAWAEIRIFLGSYFAAQLIFNTDVCLILKNVT